MQKKHKLTMPLKRYKQIHMTEKLSMDVLYIYLIVLPLTEQHEPYPTTDCIELIKYALTNIGLKYIFHKPLCKL